MASESVAFSENPRYASGDAPSCCSPSRPRTGRRIARDSLLWMRPIKSGDCWGLSAQKVPRNDCTDAKLDKDEDVTSREEFVAINLKEHDPISEIEVEFSSISLKKDEEGDASGDEGSTTGESDGCRESSDEDPSSVSTLTLLSPATCLSSTASPVKCTAPRLSLEAALYNATASPLSAGNSSTNGNIPPAPWWWPSPQFDAPEVEVLSPENEAEDVLRYGAPPGLSTPPGIDVKEDDVASPVTAAPPGLEDTAEVQMADIPQGVSAPPSFNASFIGLPASLTSPSDSDLVPPPPTWSAEDATVDHQLSSIGSDVSGTSLPPTWWPPSPTSAALDTAPPPPSWSADEASSDAKKDEGSDGMAEILPSSPTCLPPLEDAEMSDATSPASSYTTPPPLSYDAPGFEPVEASQDAEAEVIIPPSPSCPPPPPDTQVNDLTPPPPSYNAPGFESSSVSPSIPSCIDSLPHNVAAPPAEPPKLMLSLENLKATTAPPPEAPKDLPKVQVSLDDLTSPTKAAPAFMTPPAYMAPGFVPEYFNKRMPPNFSPFVPPMAGAYPSPIHTPASWGQW